MKLFEDLIILLYVGEIGRKCIQVGANLSAAYTQLIRYDLANYSYS